MGCGASTRRRRDYVTSPLSMGSSPRVPTDAPPVMPWAEDEVVLAEASSWNKGSTHLVFLWGGAEPQVDPGGRSRKSSIATVGTIGTIATMEPKTPQNAQKSMENLKRQRRGRQNAEQSGLQRLGSFYAKERRTFGVWRISGNVLQLVWSHDDNRTDTIIAKHSERVWVNDKTNMTVKVLEPARNPKWFKPDTLSHRFLLDSVHSRNFECPVCYFDLWRIPGGVIRHHSRRSCSHYFHLPCAKYLLKRSKREGKLAGCPVCHSVFSEVQPLPDLAVDRRSWFSVCDSDLSGELEQLEVVEALGAVLPVSRDKLERRLKANWSKWDPDGDGRISMTEFLRQGKGLCDWILIHQETLRKNIEKEEPPNLDQNPRAWFNYWDKDCSASLEREEVVRALLRSFCGTSRGDPILKWAHDMREAAMAVWQGLGYKAFDSVDFEEFSRPYGLMDQFLHNQMQTMYFGQDEVVAID
eukprot:CAMPEP_0178389748 /NCGR_PEP_ID=MMETSP0689_2-20121128/10286_1 /TAXON_ID=160604 /ORGANISM="Amphidinium massartii, Strain CS-259" /LENGTH=467 /DNA_ID=CAMNT_0020010227 /DNA_START=56 /DNA_END=1456 /DNA_ORIENTATION=-